MNILNILDQQANLFLSWEFRFVCFSLTYEWFNRSKAVFSKIVVFVYSALNIALGVRNCILILSYSRLMHE